MKRVVACLVLAVAVAGCGPSMGEVEETRQRCEYISDDIIATGDAALYDLDRVDAALSSYDSDRAGRLLDQVEEAMDYIVALFDEFDTLGCEELVPASRDRDALRP